MPVALKNRVKKTYIPIEKRLEAQNLLNAGVSQREVSRRLKISLCGVQYNYVRIATSSHLKNRKKRTTIDMHSEAVKFIDKRLAEEPQIVKRDLKRGLAELNIILSSKQIAYRIKLLGYEWKKMKKAQVISEKNREKRLQFSAYVRRTKCNFDRHIMVDECTIQLGKRTGFCWVKKGQPIPVIGQLPHGKGLHVFGGISREGPTKVMYWSSKERMNSEWYCRNSIDRIIAPAGKKLFNNNFLLVQDNHPSHNSFETREYLASIGIRRCGFCPQSPDFNGSEFIWRDLKAYIKTRKPKSEKALVQLIHDFWTTKMTKAYCNTVIDLAVRNIHRCVDGLNHEHDNARKSVYNN